MWGGRDDYFKSLVPGGCCLSANHSTSEHAQCRVSFWYLHTRKRTEIQKAPLLPLCKRKKKKKGNLQALLENWPIGGLEQDTFVRPRRPGRWLRRGGGSPPRRHSPGSGASWERGPAGVGGGGSGARAPEQPRPQHPLPRARRAPRPQLAAPDGSFPPK